MYFVRISLFAVHAVRKTHKHGNKCHFCMETYKKYMKSCVNICYARVFPCLCCYSCSILWLKTCTFKLDWCSQDCSANSVVIKLDVVGPIDNRPSTNLLHHFVQCLLRIIFFSEIFFDMWEVTGDMWHMTRETWYMTHSVIRTFSQNFNSLDLPVWDWHCLEDIWTKGWVNEWITYWGTEVIVEQPGLHRVC